MRCSLRGVLFAIAVLVPLLPGCAEMFHKKDKPVDPQAAVVQIESKQDGQPTVSGRGFIVSPDGIVATCAKLVANGQTLQVKLSDGRALAGKFLEQDKDSGVALIQVQQVEPLPVLAIYDGDIVPGMHVRALCSAGITHGRFDHWENFGRDVDFTAPVQPQDCGAPLLADNDRVMGIVLGPIPNQPGEFDAAPIWQIVRLMPTLQPHQNEFSK